MPHKLDTRDRRVAGIAARQHGVITTWQLLGAGLARSSVRDRCGNGHLYRIHRGVYAVGHRGLSQEGRWMAAVIAYGKGAVLSHRSAAALWKLLPPRNELISVSVPSVSGRRKRSGIRLHRCPSLQSVHVTRRLGIPVTTPARTIADLQRVDPDPAKRALRQAAVIGIRLPEEVDADRTRSELEEMFLKLCRRHRLPTPEVNAHVGPFTVDFLWRSKRLIVETDGYRYHRGRQAFEDDRSRDIELLRMGFEVLRVTYRQLTNEPTRLAGALRGVLVNRPTPHPGPRPRRPPSPQPDR